jgi:hypothetical protein
MITSLIGHFLAIGLCLLPLIMSCNTDTIYQATYANFDGSQNKLPLYFQLSVSFWTTRFTKQNAA